MKLEFVGSIEAVRVGDYIVGSAVLQNRVTGAFIKVEKKLSLPALVEYTKAIVTEARKIQQQYQPSHEALEGLGAAKRLKGKDLDDWMTQQKLAATVKQLRANVTQASNTTAKNQLQQRLDRVLQQQTQTQQRLQELQAKSSGAARDMAAKLKDLQDQLAARDANDDAGDQLAEQAAQYEEQIAKLRERSRVNGEIAQAGSESLEGLGWGWSDIEGLFKKSLAIATRSKMIQGLVQAALTSPGRGEADTVAKASLATSGEQPANAGPAAALMGAPKVVAGVWVVPGFNLPAADVLVWLRLIRAARSGHQPSLQKLNRIKVMARLGQPQATKLFWLLRDLEKLASAHPQLVELVNPAAGLHGLPANHGEPEMVALGAARRQLKKSARKQPAPRQKAKINFKIKNAQTGQWKRAPMAMALRKRTPIYQPTQAQPATRSQNLTSAVPTQNQTPSPYSYISQASPLAQSQLSPYSQQLTAQSSYGQPSYSQGSSGATVDYTQGSYAAQSYGQAAGPLSYGAPDQPEDYGSMDPVDDGGEGEGGEGEGGEE